MSSEDQAPRERILGVDFFNGSAADAAALMLNRGGCVLIPAAPALVKLNYDEDYRRALLSADLVLADSGLLAQLWQLRTGRRLQAVSGIEYLRALLASQEFRQGEQACWIVRSDDARARALDFFKRAGLRGHPENILVARAEAPHGEDHRLLYAIEERKPRHVIIALARRQEELGIYLRDYLLERPAVHCVGAALGFLTGEEKAIPEWAQRHHLGWLARLTAQPRMLLPRLGMAVTLTAMIFRYRSELPTLRVRWTDL